MTRRSSSPLRIDRNAAAVGEAPTDPHPSSAASPDLSRALGLLRERLEALEFGTIYRLHCYELAPRLLAESLQQTLRHAPPRVQMLYRLFYFDEPVPRREIYLLLGAELVRDLLAAGILALHGASDAVACPYRLEIAGDTWLFTVNLARRSRVYFGEDSQFLRSMLRPLPGETCVDLCTGTGIQGLRCAQIARHVDLVDIQPAAVRVAALNVALNGLGDRVSIFEGDLWTPLPPGRRYDYVVCNPPLMPVVEALEFPVFGHGGPDGLKVVRRILAGLDERLTEDGRCTVIGACTGDAQRADVLALAAATLGRGFEGKLFLLLQIPLRDWIRLIAQTVSLYYPEIGLANAVLRSRTAYGERFDELFVYTYLLKCRRTSAPATWETIDYSRVGQHSYWFVNRGTLTQ